MENSEMERHYVRYFHLINYEKFMYLDYHIIQFMGLSTHFLTLSNLSPFQRHRNCIIISSDFVFFLLYFYVAAHF